MTNEEFELKNIYLIYSSNFQEYIVYESFYLTPTLQNTKIILFRRFDRFYSMGITNLLI